MNPKITILGGLTFILSALPVLIVQTGSIYTGLASGISVLAFLGCMKLLDRKILEESSGRKTKAFQDLIKNLSIFLIIGSAGLTEIVPSWLAVLTVGLLGATKVFQLQMSRRYRKSFRQTIGEDYWIAVTALVFLGSYFNSYFLFYGLIVLCLVIGYDLGTLTRKIKR
ncbi:MAG: hypothetical protein ACI8Z7_000592 [Candidatus Nanohaloarchaea archaeon]